MEEVLMPIAVMGSFGASLYFFTKVMTDYILKKKMIEKGYVNEETQAVFKNHEEPVARYAPLKWGLLLLAFGLALVLIDFVIDVRADSPGTFGIVAIFLSVAFLAYYLIINKKSVNKQ